MWSVRRGQEKNEGVICLKDSEGVRSVRGVCGVCEGVRKRTKE
jgi:hypothetical protein